MVMAAAEVNPAVTGTEMKSMTNPEIKTFNPKYFKKESKNSYLIVEIPKS